MRHYFLPLFFCIVCTSGFAQTVRINFQLSGLQASHALVGCYRAGNTFRIDSMDVDPETGAFVFSKNNQPPGIYFVAANGSRLFDFMVPNATDSFAISGDVSEGNMIKATGSPENEAYFTFEKQRQSLEAKIIARQSMYDMVSQATSSDPTALKPIEQEIDGYYQTIDSMARAFVVRYPTHLYARMLHSVRPPSPPKSIVPALKGKVNPNYQRWMRKHYWDYTDFKDETLLNNPFWPTFFDNYFDRFVTPIPDSITAAVDEVLKKMPVNGAFYRFSILRFVQNFELLDAPGADIIFVHMVDNYLKANSTPWMDIATLSRLEYKADAFRPVLTGQAAPSVVLQDENERPVRFDTIAAPFTLLIFYSPLCSHCMEVMPDIYQTWLDARPFGLQAVAVASDNQFRNWQQFIRQQHWEWYDLGDPDGGKAYDKKYLTNNLPVIYLLDKNKRILLKRIKPEVLRETLKRYLGGKN